MDHRLPTPRSIRILWLALILASFVATGMEQARAASACLNGYPVGAQRRNEEGITVVSFDVATDGSVSNVQVAKSSGFADLDLAAVTCASKFHYKPAMKDGVPVAVPWHAEFDWTLK